MSEPGDSSLQFAKQLFYHQGEQIRIDIRLGFEGEKLKLDGYDIGETVREIWGDSDYEYFITVAGEALEKLYRLSGIEVGRKQELVDHLAKTFSLNEAFSSFREYLTASEIGFESFTWA
jgi:hypothetical protein